MKFCYIDESGIGDEPYAIMSGIILDANRMHVTKSEWEELLSILSDIVGRDVREIHTRDFYPGNSPRRGLAGDVRARIITAIFGWLQLRKHKVVFTGVDKATFARGFNSERFALEIGSLWRFMALHLCLAIQKHHQSLRRNKGHTVIVFDNEEREAGEFIELVRMPPEWTDTYYSRSSRQERFDQIIDVPYFGDSRHVGLIQLADVVSFFLRRYLEIESNQIPPRYEGEEELVRSWVGKVFEQSIPKSMTFLERGRCECADLFHRYGPQQLTSG